VDARLVRLIVLVVSGIWAISILADLVFPAYDPPPSVHVAMMAVVGAATGQYIVGRGGRKNDDAG
jgi:hypothetical protein